VQVGYGAQTIAGDYIDVWGAIENKIEEGWFLPSGGELSAFGYNLGISRDNYKNKELPEKLWTSSQGSKSRAWVPDLINEMWFPTHVDEVCAVRLSTIF